MNKPIRNDIEMYKKNENHLQMKNNFAVLIVML